MVTRVAVAIIGPPPERMPMEFTYIKPAQAAVKLGISRSTIYRRVRMGRLPVQREKGRMMVGIESSQRSAPQKPPSAQRPCGAPPTTGAPPPSSGGQRDLVILPKERPRMAFFEVFTWR
jgi:predicted DNA-binding transcriptional regulator AlpA